jgi:methionine aminopeptidase
MAKTNQELIDLVSDYTLANPDTLTKYKQAGEISQKVLKAVSGTFVPQL